MILSYKECIEKYKNDYQINKAIEEEELYRVESGIYSTKKYYDEVEVIMKKYPGDILTGEYAFYYHGLTDVIPEIYHLATKEKAKHIKDAIIKQVYIKNDLLELGVIRDLKNGYEIRIYDKERMLIELLRYKNKIPYDLYKEIIGNYRKQIDELEIWRIQEYANIFPKGKMISRALDEEVF